MPYGWLIELIIIQFKEHTVWVDDSLLVEPGRKNFVFRQAGVGVSDWTGKEKCGNKRLNQSDSDWGGEVAAFPGEFGLHEVIELGYVVQGLQQINW